MPLLAILEQAAFDALADETVLGKDSYVKDEKTNTFRLAMDGVEAGKLALPLQQEVAKLKTNNEKLLDEKIKKAAEVEKFTKLGKTAEEIDEILKSGKTPAMEDLEKSHAAQIESLKTENQKALVAAQEEIQTAKTESDDTKKHLVSTMKRTMIAELKNEFDMNGLADDWFANRIEIVYDENSNKYEPRVMKDGDVAYKATQFMTPKQLAEEAKENKDLAGMFNAGLGAGSGADGRQRPLNLNGAITVSREASKTNPRLYQQAKEEAAKTGAEIVFTD